MLVPPSAPKCKIINSIWDNRLSLTPFLFSNVQSDRFTRTILCCAPSVYPRSGHKTDKRKDRFFSATKNTKLHPPSGAIGFKGARGKAIYEIVYICNLSPYISLYALSTLNIWLLCGVFCLFHIYIFCHPQNTALSRVLSFSQSQSVCLKSSRSEKRYQHFFFRRLSFKAFTHIDEYDLVRTGFVAEPITKCIVFEVKDLRCDLCAAWPLDRFYMRMRNNKKYHWG